MANLYHCQRCLGCGRQNDPPSDRCPTCGDLTSWPSAEDFRAYLLRTKRQSTIGFLKGAAETFLGLLFSVTVLVVLRQAAADGYLLVGLLMLLLTLAVTIHGGIQMKRASRGLLFE
jgi:hypothetical protein